MHWTQILLLLKIDNVFPGLHLLQLLPVHYKQLFEHDKALQAVPDKTKPFLQLVHFSKLVASWHVKQLPVHYRQYPVSRNAFGKHEVQVSESA